MKILIVGSGAREHAIAKALARSAEVPQIFCFGTSHNPGIENLSKGYWVGNINSVTDVVKKAADWQVDLAIIGPEAPLEIGLADALWDASIPTVGPKKN